MLSTLEPESAYSAFNLNLVVTLSLHTYTEVTCASAVVSHGDSPRDAAAKITAALAACARHSRPVYIEVPTAREASKTYEYDHSLW